eukprot:scaffold243482_cov22-Tisochrysis_lutea.AAC.1
MRFLSSPGAQLMRAAPCGKQQTAPSHLVLWQRSMLMSHDPEALDITPDEMTLNADIVKGYCGFCQVQAALLLQ